MLRDSDPPSLSCAEVVFGVFCRVQRGFILFSASRIKLYLKSAVAHGHKELIFPMNCILKQFSVLLDVLKIKNCNLVVKIKISLKKRRA